MSKPRPMVVVNKTTYGELPGYLHLAQRHLEKANPAGEVSEGGMTYSIPVDLLRLTVPEELVNEIEEVTLVYDKK
jgi:hypothetical protein